MEATFNTNAVIIDRRSHRERDSRIVVFTKEKGRMDLIARGAKKISSKVSAHIEPISLSRLMVVPGRQFNYVGSARGEKLYLGIKSDLERSVWAGKVLMLFNKLTREGEEGDFESQFYLLRDTLDLFEISSISLLSDLYDIFVFKLLGNIGFLPDLHSKGVNPKTIKFLKYCQNNGIKQIAKLDLKSDIMAEVSKMVKRSLIDNFDIF